VLVHDAARCLLRPAWVQRLIDACRTTRWAACWRCRWPIRSSRPPTGRVQATVSRADKWLAQTPQMFRLGLLQRALRAAGDGGHRRSQRHRSAGPGPALVPGEIENLKLTWPADFALAARLMETR
jgi:2-C-methyl-D-erythritol 4-phosphate cytidylyltransferase